MKRLLRKSPAYELWTDSKKPVSGAYDMNEVPGHTDEKKTEQF